MTDTECRTFPTGTAIDTDLERALKRAGANRQELLQAIGKAGPHADDMAFLVANMPDRDLVALGADFLLEQVRYAHLAMDISPGRQAVPRDIFLNYILPYANLDERRDNWRRMFHETFAPMVRYCVTLKDAVLTLNRHVYRELDVAYHATRRPHDNMSPFESTAAKYASCTGLSILLVSACRAVGIPARVAGIPLWSDQSGNHSWVEVLDAGLWHFIGANEPGGYDRAWFNDKVRATDASRPLHRVYAASFKRTDTQFPLFWNPGCKAVHAVDVTERYTRCPQEPPLRINVPEPRHYICRHTATPPAIDGRLDAPVWQRAAWTAPFVDIEGDARPAPRFRTRAKMLWDEQYLYVGACLEEPHVRGTLTETNSVIFNDNDFEVFIDPDGDNHDYYEFEVNALNTIWELSLAKPYRDGGPVRDCDNLPGLRCAVHTDGTVNDSRDTDRSWSVTIAFPWKGLSKFAGRTACPPNPGDQWRMNFSRVEWLADLVDGRYVKIPKEQRPEDNWVWSPQGVVNMHCPETWGQVQFSREGPGADAFVPDGTWPARALLMEIYRRQAERDVPAPTLVDLGIPPEPFSTLADGVEIVCGERDWTAKVVFEDAKGARRTLCTRQDSLIWEEPGISPHCPWSETPRL